MHDVYEQAIKKMSQTQIKFNLIIIDPPYRFQDEDYGRIMKLIHQGQLLETHAWIMIESRRSLKFIQQEPCILDYHLKIKKYGRTFLTILWKS